MTHLHGERPNAWITAAEQAALPSISRFAAGLNASPVTDPRQAQPKIRRPFTKK